MSDRYTKAVLTIIAAALVAIVAQNATSTLNAQSGGATRLCGNDPYDDMVRCVSVRKTGTVSGRDAYGLEVTR